MKKYLQFIDAADDAATFPAEYLQSMVCDANATLKFRFHPSTKGTAHLTDIVTLTITADTEQAVMTALAKEISLGKDSVISLMRVPFPPAKRTTCLTILKIISSVVS